MASKKQLPSTLERSSPKAQRTWRKTHDAAADRYGDDERAHRTAYASLKRTFEKKEGHWVRKSEPGPSDPRSKQPSTSDKRAGKGETFSGIDVEGNSRQALYERARKAGIQGRSRMNKKQLARALAKHE
jgi:cation transport regulator ChaB